MTFHEPGHLYGCMWLKLKENNQTFFLESQREILELLCLRSLHAQHFPGVLCVLRHHSSALSDGLHANGCRDYASHFRFGTTDWLVFLLLQMLVYLTFSWIVVTHRMSEQHPVCFRSVLCQYHGDCWDVSGGHSHSPPVPSPHSEQWTNATLGALSNLIYNKR